MKKLICLLGLSLLFYSCKSTPPEKPLNNAQWIQILEQRMRDKHVGGPNYAVPNSSSAYVLYENSVESARKLALKGLKNYSDYRIKINSSGLITDAKKLKYFDFEKFITDFYALGLALHLNPENESKAKARNFIKYLQWNNFSRKDLDRKSEYYLGGFGRAFFLCKEVMDKNDRQFAVDFLFGKVSDPGKAGVAKALYIAENGPVDKEIGYRQNDVLRGRSESLLCAIFLLPDSSLQEKAHKLAKFESAHKAILSGLTPSKGVYGFLKPDFTASHHMYHYVSAYTPQGLSSLAAMAAFLKDSPWQFSDQQLKYLRGAARELYFYAHHDSIPLGLTGRMFSNNMLEQCYSVLPLASVAGQGDDLDLLQTFCNTYRNGIGTEYAPLSRLNQQGFPGYISAYAQTLDKIKELKLKPKAFERVNSYPYSPAMAMQYSNWTAFTKGMSKWWWSYEGGLTASNPQAIFGIYKSHGALEIAYRDPLDPTGGKTLNPSIRQGMDMAHLPGITAPARSDDDMIKDIIASRLKINSTSVGGAHLGNKFGLFMFDLKNTPEEMKDPGFSAKKSYFFMGDHIIALGTGINSSSDKYPIHTTIFQNRLKQLNPNLYPLIIDSKKIAAFPYSLNLSNEMSTTLIDSDGTAYYVPPGQELRIERKKVSWAPMTRLTGDRKASGIQQRQRAALALQKEQSNRALVWLDHGKRPIDASYEYSVLPGANEAQLKEFKQKQDKQEVYEFIEKSAQAHILHHKDKQIWSYALYDDFQANDKGPLKEVNIHNILPHEHEKVDAHPGYAVLIKENSTKEIDLALSFLDLRLRQDYDSGLAIKKKGGIFYGSAPLIVKVIIEGAWALASEIDTVELSHSGNKTTFLIKCQDGLSQNLKLKSNN